MMSMPLPEPPHVSILIGKEAVGIITAVFNIVKAAAELCALVATGFGTRERTHQLLRNLSTRHSFSHLIQTAEHTVLSLS